MAKRNRKQTGKSSRSGSRKTDSSAAADATAGSGRRKGIVWVAVVGSGLLALAGWLRTVDQEGAPGEPPPIASRGPNGERPSDNAAGAVRQEPGNRAATKSPQATGSPGSSAQNEQSDAQVATLEIDQTVKQQGEQERALDPRNDGWETEALSEMAQARYKELSKWIVALATPTPEQLADFATDDFRAPRLRPRQLADVYRDRRVIVRRGAADSTGADDVDAEPYQGTKGLGEALAELLSLVRQGEDIHVKFKHFRIKSDKSIIDTSVYFHLSAQLDAGPVEENATWHCRWQVGNDDKLRLAEIRVEDFEQIVTETGGPFLFADCTESALKPSAIYNNQLKFGIDYWRNQYAANLNIQYHGHLGLALGDVNNDGRTDIYLCQPGGLPNGLLIQQPDGTVRNKASAAGVDFLNYTRGALLVDFDNDGNQDLAAGVTDQFILLAGDGNAKFEIKQQFPQIKGAYSLAAADFDEDGDLDLYICRYQSEKTDKGEFPVPYPYYDANNGGRNILLRNETRPGGPWKFVDATDEVGLDADNSKFSFAASWDDFDNDGDLDLYVANDFGRNCLYRNDNGTFASGSAQAGLNDTAFGMSVTWGDFNRDGAMDLYIGNMFSAAGNRITFQPQFKPDVSDDVRAKIQRTAKGNSLFQNLGDGTFEDVSVPAAVTMGRWTWGSTFADLNNDGWEDLLVTNGNVTGELNDDL